MLVDDIGQTWYALLLPYVQSFDHCLHVRTLQYQLAASTSIWTLHRQIDDEYPRRQLPNIC
jgi:hypothetical protein